MLREVKNKHVKPRIVPFKVTVSSTAATVNTGYGDCTATRTGDGAFTLSNRQGFSRNGLVFTSQADLGDGGYTTLASSSGSSSAFSLLLKDSAGNDTDGNVDGFCFGWDSSDANLVKQQRVGATQNSPRIIWGKIASAGTVAIGTSDFSVTRASTGVYTVTFKKAFCQTPLVLVTGISTSTTAAHTLVARSASGCTINMADATGTLTNFDFYIVVIGSQSRSDSARGRMPLENSQRLPRIVAGQVTNTGGTWSLSIGGATGGIDFTSLTDNGAGDFSVTLTDLFKRECAVILSTTTQRAQVHSNSSGVIRVLTKAANGTNTDTNGITQIFCIGSDDASQY